jgi:pyrroline-5-carboxylate reductase
MGARLTVVGGGRMGEALLGGLVAAGWAPADLAVVEVVPARLEELRAAHPGVAVAERCPATSSAVLAVKPGDVAAAAASAASAGATRLLSIAAGVPTAAVEAAAGPGVAVVRAMPNTPALVGRGAAAIAAGSTAGDEDLAWAEDVLGAVGTVVRLPEHALDAVTGLSGSGPAYVFLVAEALVDAGVTVGLPRPAAVALVTQLLVGSAEMLARSGQGAEELRAGVTSPGGTTAAGVRALEARAVRSAFIEAVVAATERSRELGS